MAYIRKSTFLRSLDSRLQEVLCDKMTLKKFERVSAFQHHAQPLSSLWFVRQGDVEVRGAEAEVVARISSGGFFGEQLLSDAACYPTVEVRREHLLSPATFVAAAGTELLQLTIDDFLDAAMGTYFFPRSEIREVAMDLDLCPQLQAVPLSKRIDIAACTIGANFKRGESLLQQGRIHSAAIIVLTGDVMVSSTPVNSRQAHRVCLGRPGAMYGLASAATSEKQHINLVAQGAVTCRIVPVAALQQQLKPEDFSAAIAADAAQVQRWQAKALAIQKEIDLGEHVALYSGVPLVPNSYKGAAAGTGFACGIVKADHAFVEHDIARTAEELTLPTPSEELKPNTEPAFDISTIVDAPVQTPAQGSPVSVAGDEEDYTVNTSFLSAPTPPFPPKNVFGEELSALERTSMYLHPTPQSGSPPRRKGLRPLAPELLPARPFTPLAEKASKSSLTASSILLSGSPTQRRRAQSLSDSMHFHTSNSLEVWPATPALPPPLDPLAHAVESGFWQEKHIPKHARKPRRSSQVEESHRMHERVLERMRLLRQTSAAKLQGRSFSGAAGESSRAAATFAAPQSPIRRVPGQRFGESALPHGLFLGLTSSPLKLLRPLQLHQKHKAASSKK